MEPTSDENNSLDTDNSNRVADALETENPNGKAEPISGAELLSPEKDGGVSQKQSLDDAAPEKTVMANGSQPAQNITGPQLLTPPTAAASWPVEQQPKRKPGRPFGSKNSAAKQEQPQSIINVPTVAPSDPNNSTAADPNSAQAPAVNYRQAAEMAFDISTGAAAGLIGPEWACNGKAEREMVVVPLEVYLKQKDIVDLPPGWILAIAILSYSSSRLKAPATQSKIKTGYQWIKSKLSKAPIRIYNKDDNRAEAVV